MPYRKYAARASAELVRAAYLSFSNGAILFVTEDFIFTHGLTVIAVGSVKCECDDNLRCELPSLHRIAHEYLDCASQDSHNSEKRKDETDVTFSTVACHKSM